MRVAPRAVAHRLLTGKIGMDRGFEEGEVRSGARKPEHARENAAAGDILLKADDMARMRRDAEALGPQNPHR